MKTKKTFKKVAGAVTAAILASCTIIPMTTSNVSAESIIINNTQSGHIYEAYQIFSGTLSNGTLSDIKWGSGVDENKQVEGKTLIQKINEMGGDFAALATAADVAEKLAANSDKKQEFAKIVGKYLKTPAGTSTEVPNADNSVYTINLTAPGYYLVKDSDISNLSGHATYTNYILQVLGDETITAKSGLPTLTKKVLDKNDSYPEQSENYQDSADYDINDNVPFQLKSTVDAKVDDYDGYSFVIHDTLSEGLTYNDDITVQIGSNTLTKDNDFSAVYSGTSLTITIDDFENKANAGDIVTIDYTAKLNNNAKIGSEGNPNTAYLQYSNNPNDNLKTGKTPEDKVTVFTYKTVITKIDGSSTNTPKPKLTGAKFKLQKHNGTNWVDLKTIPDTGEEQTNTFTFTGLDDGKYQLVELDAPNGFNKLSNPIEFEIKAEHEADSETPQLTNLTVDSDEAFNVSIADGLITADIENKAGSVLPSTGGIGTAPFYIGGGVLVAAAGVYIIVRKRMKNNDSNEK